MNASDFTDNSLTGIATVTNGQVIITKTLANDLTTEGAESFIVNLKTGSINGPIVATSPIITVVDTSAAIVTITPTTTSLNEGSPVTFNITSNQLSKTLYWDINTVSGTINTSDFTGAAVSGSFITNGSGVGSTTLTLANDLSMGEGTESFQLRVRNGSIDGPIVQTSETITVADTSVGISASVTPSTTSLNEGSPVTFTINTTNFTSGTLYWTLNTVSGTINTSDFVENTTSGSFNISSSTGSVTLTLKNDFSIGEGTESFQLRVRSGSTSGTILTTSSTITVADTSTITVTPTTTSLNEGSPVTFNVASDQFSTTLYWDLNTVSGTINTSDFVENIISGSFATNSSGVGSTTLTLANDLTTEGTESFQLRVRSGSTSGTILTTSSTITVADTSTPSLYAFTTATFNVGGATGATGPSLAQAISGLSGPEVGAWGSNTSYFNTSSGIQLWTVPKTGTYEIEVAGARGGGNNTTPGYGARMIGRFSLSTGDILKILVGQQGLVATAPCGGNAGGGGGGTFVATNSNVALIVAGGGGGSSSRVITASLLNGTTTTSGNNGDGSAGGLGGTSGGGGAIGTGCVTGSSGGGGFTGNGTSSGTGGPGTSFVNGGTGGSGSTAAGGFGGGSGTAQYTGGGGGGYSGGGGGGLNTCACNDLNGGGGGGSYNNGSNQSNTGGVNTSNGYAKITFIV